MDWASSLSRCVAVGVVAGMNGSLLLFDFFLVLAGRSLTGHRIIADAGPGKSVGQFLEGRLRQLFAAQLDVSLPGVVDHQTVGPVLVVIHNRQLLAVGAPVGRSIGRAQ